MSGYLIASMWLSGMAGSCSASTKFALGLLKYLRFSHILVDGLVVLRDCLGSFCRLCSKLATSDSLSSAGCVVDDSANVGVGAEVNCGIGCSTSLTAGGGGTETCSGLSFGCREAMGFDLGAIVLTMVPMGSKSKGYIMIGSVE